MGYPFCHLKLKGKHPTIVARAKCNESIDLSFLGPLIAARRAERGQTLKEASRELGIVHQTLYKWEHGYQIPHLQLYSRVISYLGYDPWAGSDLSFGDRLRQARLRLGVSRECLAERLGISCTTYDRWEDDQITRPHLKERRLLEAFLRTGQTKPDL